MAGIPTERDFQLHLVGVMRPCVESDIKGEHDRAGRRLGEVHTKADAVTIRFGLIKLGLLDTTMHSIAESCDRGPPQFSFLYNKKSDEHRHRF